MGRYQFGTKWVLSRVVRCSWDQGFTNALPESCLDGKLSKKWSLLERFLLEDLEVIWTLELQCKVNQLLNINFASFSHIAEHSTFFLLGSKYYVIRMNHSKVWISTYNCFCFQPRGLFRTHPTGTADPLKPGSAEPCETCCSWRCWTSTVAQKMDVVPEPIGHHPFDQPRPRNSGKWRFIGIPEPKNMTNILLVTIASLVGGRSKFWLIDIHDTQSLWNEFDRQVFNSLIVGK